MTMAGNGDGPQLGATNTVSQTKQPSRSFFSKLFSKKKKAASLLEQNLDFSGHDFSHSSIADLFDDADEKQARHSIHAGQATNFTMGSPDGHVLGPDGGVYKGQEFDPDAPYTRPEEISLTSAEKQALIEAQRQKELGLHNCLAITSCQLLRKPLDKIKGRTKTWKTLWIGHFGKRRTDLMDKILVRCLGHTDMVGPEYNANCKGCPAARLWGNNWKKNSETCKY